MSDQIIPRFMLPLMSSNFIPTGFELYRENGLARVYSLGNKAIAYIGKRSKHEWYYSFPSKEDMDNQINKLFANLEAWEQRKKQRKEIRKQNNVTKITIATIKKFINTNKPSGKLFVKLESSFDGMVDCVMPCNDQSWRAVDPEVEAKHENSFGVSGAWFVLRSRDYFTPFEDETFQGYHVSNCCGSFTLAIKK